MIIQDRTRDRQSGGEAGRVAHGHAGRGHGGGGSGVCGRSYSEQLPHRPV